MNTPTKRILLSLLVLIVLAVLFSLITKGSLDGLFIVLLGAVIGPYMGLTYPFPVLFKVGYIAVLVLAVVAVIVGVRLSGNVVGQVAVVLGMAAWTIAGLMGLGTGT